MKDGTFWKSHYVLEANPDEIASRIESLTFVSGGRKFELLYFGREDSAPNVLISQGSGGHPYVFAELAYLIHLRGYNTFIMPKHGGCTISELAARERDALGHISAGFGKSTGIFAEGLGGFVTFYLALSHAPFQSMGLQNSPGILTDPEFQRAVLSGHGPIMKRIVVPLLRLMNEAAPQMPLPISLYLNWEELVDSKEDNRVLEGPLVSNGYLKDPDFDRWYPISAIMSLLATPPPGPVADLSVPTMFMVATRGFGGNDYEAYVKKLYNNLPAIRKTIVEVDGSVYWMLSHPQEAAAVICDWFDKTVRLE